jgi:hypothetical protein
MVVRGMLLVALSLVATGCPIASVVCPDWGCGTNAASMGQRLVFHELDACKQQANSAGIRFVRFTDKAGNDLTLQVDRDELVGRDGAGARLTGAQLLGATLLLDASGKPFEVKITDVGDTDFWVGGGKAPTYTFQYRRAGAGAEELVQLCKGSPVPAGSTDPQVASQLALVFAGDRYDAARKTVTQTSPECWFNVACAGTAVAKMHLLRHTWAGSTGPYVTQVPERQAMLKMLTDDICGTGLSFTRDGMLVYYADRHAPPWHPFAPVGAPAPTIGSMEAVWDPDGAVCLDVPRREKEVPGIGSLIGAECAKTHARATCQSAGLDLTNWSKPTTNYGVSANPP